MEPGGAVEPSVPIVDLIESLEARVELMSQMQHTRAAIQQRAQTIMAYQSNQEFDDMDEMDDAAASELWSGEQQDSELWSRCQDQRVSIQQLEDTIADMRQQMAAMTG